MTPKIIAIIGGTGKMGSMFVKAFKEKGYEVLIAGRQTELKIEEAAAKADVVIVTVPIRNTEEVIRKIGPAMKKEALLTDFTSVKTLPCKWMKKYSKSEIIGGHPVFGPVKSLAKRTFVLCPTRGRNYLQWYKGFLEELGMQVFIKTPAQHDELMAIVQCLNHFSNLTLSNALTKTRFSMKELESFASHAFWLRIHAIGRLLANNSELYSDIENYNIYAKKMNKLLLESTKEIFNTIRSRSPKEFEKIFKESQDYFSDVKEKSMSLTNKWVEDLE